MIEKILQIDHDAMGKAIFVTLTYPENFPTCGRAREHLESFHKRVARRYGEECPMLWRIELQARGAPHFHVVYWGIKRMDKKWLSRVWFEIVGSGDLKHKQAGTKVEHMRSKNGTMFYVAKYCSKVTDDDTEGRAWGIKSRRYLKMHPETKREIPLEVFEAFGELYDEKVKRRETKRQGFTLYGDEVAALARDVLDALPE